MTQARSRSNQRTMTRLVRLVQSALMRDAALAIIDETLAETGQTPVMPGDRGHSIHSSLRRTQTADQEHSTNRDQGRHQVAYCVDASDKACSETPAFQWPMPLGSWRDANYDPLRAG